MGRKWTSDRLARTQELRRSGAAGPHRTKEETEFEAIDRELREQELERRVTRLEAIVDRWYDDGK